MRLYFSIILCLICLLFGACNLNLKPVNQATISPSPTPASPTIQDEWQTIADGLEWRTYIPNNNVLAQLVTVRIDPQKYHFRAHYHPGQALSIQQWQADNPSAIAIINTNFFSPQHEINGLLVSDSIAYGKAYQDRGGTFAVQNGIPRIFSNIAEPYQGQIFEQAVQAFPMLVQNGQQAYTTNRNDPASRRSVIAQDSQGRIILMATPLLGLSLTELSAYLPTSDLNIITAFNLDGGGSTMLTIPPINYAISSFDPVPAVLAVYPS